MSRLHVIWSVSLSRVMISDAGGIFNACGVSDDVSKGVATMRTVPKRPATPKRFVGPRTVQQLLGGVSMDIDALSARPTAAEVQGVIDRLAAIRDRILSEVP